MASKSNPDGEREKGHSIGHISWNATNSAYFTQTLEREYKTRQKFSDNKYNLQRTRNVLLGETSPETAYLVEFTKSKIESIGSNNAESKVLTAFSELECNFPFTRNY